MVVHILMLALLQLTSATHSGWNLPRSNSKKSFLEDAMKEMDGIESLTEPQRIPAPKVIKVLIGPEHPLFRHNRHHHRHHRHHRHYFNRNVDLIFPPRPTKPHTDIGRIKDRENGQNRTTLEQGNRINKTRKLIHDAAFMRQAVRLLVEIKKKLKSSSVKKEIDFHLNVNKTSARPANGLTDYQSISLLPEIRSIVQREKYNTRGARAAFAKAREILKIDKTRSLDHPPKAIRQRVQNGTKIMKEVNISSAVAVLENALQNATHFDTVKVVQGSGTTDRVKARGEGQNERAKGLRNATVNQHTLLSVLEKIKGNLSNQEVDFDAKFWRVIAHLRSLSNSSPNAIATPSTKEVLTGTQKESPESLTNKTMFDNQNKLAHQMKKNINVQSGDVPKEPVNNNSRNNNNKTTVFKQYTEYVKAILQHESVGSNRSTKLLTEFKIPVNNKNIINNNNNNNDDNSSKNNNSSSTTTTDNNNNNNSITNNNNNSKATALDRYAESLTKILQHTSVRTNNTVNTTSTTQNMGKPKVISGKAKYLFPSGQENHTVDVKLPQGQLASRKAFSLAMKLVKAAIAREELRKAEQELFRKMKEMMNSTDQTGKANKGSKVLEQSSSAHLASTPMQDMKNTNADSSPESATSAAAATNTEKNRKQDSESQEKYNEAAHLEENIANQQDKMYDDLVNHILDNGEDEEDEEGTIRELHREQNEDYGDFKDSDEEKQHRVFSDQDSQNAYGSPKISDTGGYTLRDEVVKPKAASNSERERRRGDKIKTSLKNRIRLKKPHRGMNQEIVASADYVGTSHIHGRKHTSKHWGKRIVHRRKRKWRRRKTIHQKVPHFAGTKSKS